VPPTRFLEPVCDRFQADFSSWKFTESLPRIRLIFLYVLNTCSSHLFGFPDPLPTLTSPLSVFCILHSFVSLPGTQYSENCRDLRSLCLKAYGQSMASVEVPREP
jgi:hypothetical protein